VRSLCCAPLLERVAPHAGCRVARLALKVALPLLERRLHAACTCLPATILCLCHSTASNVAINSRQQHTDRAAC
jgi:hypothetical protein